MTEKELIREIQDHTKAHNAACANQLLGKVAIEAGILASLGRELKSLERDRWRQETTDLEYEDRLRTEDWERELAQSWQDE